MKKTLLIVVAVLITSAAYAKTPLKIIHSCTTTTGKQLAVYRQGNDYIYSFGRKGRKPELTFRNPKKDVLTRSGNSTKNGTAGMWGEMSMENKGYEYNVFWRVNQDRVHTLSYGVEVSKISEKNNLNYSAPEIFCDKRYPIIRNTEPEFMI